MFAEVKTMWSWGTSEATSETDSYMAAPTGQVSIMPGTNGEPGKCSIIEVFVETVKATGTLGVVAVIPADSIIEYQYIDSL